jgi:hypothetical protein
MIGAVTNVILSSAVVVYLTSLGGCPPAPSVATAPVLPGCAWIATPDDTQVRRGWTREAESCFEHRTGAQRWVRGDGRIEAIGGRTWPLADR